MNLMRNFDKYVKSKTKYIGWNCEVKTNKTSWPPSGQFINECKIITEESSGDEYFNEINSVAAVVKFGSTDVQKFGHRI